MSAHGHEHSNTTARFVQSLLPTAEKHYRARFSFDPNTITMTSGTYTADMTNNTLTLSQDAEGIITTTSGDTITFHEIESIRW